ncbi:MAG TPA: HEAT repeat domain-containing protein, partial [Kofleriaceae bacterium]|nr:HEAT repeat domain-containing protein [Kofleriaceae bacterium]
ALFPQPAITTDAALRDLGSPKPRVRAAAAAALGDAEPDRRGEVVDALITALDDLDPDVRASSALSLADLGDPRAVEPLVLRMDDGVPAVRQTAAVALGRMRAAAAFEPLRQALADGPPDLRFQAATSLVEIDPPRALDPLVAALDDPDPEVVGAAALGLGSIADPAAIEPLARRLDHPAARTRFDVAYALAQLGDARASSTLVNLAGERELSWDAIEGLELVGGKAAAARLAQLCRGGPAPEHRLRAAAALLVVAPEHEDVPRARQVLTDALRGRRFRRRALAIQLLGHVGGRWAQATLEEARTGPLGRKHADEIAEALAQAGAS